MKLINFTINLAKATLKGFGNVLSVLLSIGILVGGCFAALSIVGYVSSLFGLLIVPKNGGGEYIFTGYVVMFAFVLLYAIGAGIRALYEKIKEIWQDS
jgi:hypothetical protein